MQAEDWNSSQQVDREKLEEKEWGGGGNRAPAEDEGDTAKSKQCMMAVPSGDGMPPTSI